MGELYIMQDRSSFFPKYYIKYIALFSQTDMEQACFLLWSCIMKFFMYMYLFFWFGILFTWKLPGRGRGGVVCFFPSKIPLVFVWVFRGKVLVWTKCDLNSCHLYCHCLMLCSLRNVKYQLVVGRECFCSGLCLPVGADLAGECRKPSRRTDHPQMEE